VCATIAWKGQEVENVTVINEIRQVVRRLMRSPMFTAVTLLTIAVGVGANSAVFSVVNGVLLTPLPYGGHRGGKGRRGDAGDLGNLAANLL